MRTVCCKRTCLCTSCCEALLPHTLWLMMVPQMLVGTSPKCLREGSRLSHSLLQWFSEPVPGCQPGLWLWTPSTKHPLLMYHTALRMWDYLYHSCYQLITCGQRHRFLDYFHIVENIWMELTLGLLKGILVNVKVDDFTGQMFRNVLCWILSIWRPKLLWVWVTCYYKKI